MRIYWLQKYKERQKALFVNQLSLKTICYTRTVTLFFRTSTKPPLTEPFFQTAAENVRMAPVMNADELRAGLQEVQGG